MLIIVNKLALSISILDKATLAPNTLKCENYFAYFLK